MGKGKIKNSRIKIVFKIVVGERNRNTLTCTYLEPGCVRVVEAADVVNQQSSDNGMAIANLSYYMLKCTSHFDKEIVSFIFIEEISESAYHGEQ
jgi:hypothetical protein